MKPKNNLSYYIFIFIFVSLISYTSKALQEEKKNQCDDSLDAICEKYTAPSGAYIFKCTSVSPDNHNFCSKSVGEEK